MQEAILTVFATKALEDGLEALMPDATTEQLQTAVKHLYVATSALQNELQTARLRIEQLTQQ